MYLLLKFGTRYLNNFYSHIVFFCDLFHPSNPVDIKKDRFSNFSSEITFLIFVILDSIYINFICLILANPRQKNSSLNWPEV